MTLENIKNFVEIARGLIHKLQKHESINDSQTFEMLKITLNEIERIKTHIELNNTSKDEIKILLEFMENELYIKDKESIIL